MTAWQAIEDAIVSALVSMPEGGTSILASVKAVTSRDRRSLLAAIGRERLPAAYVMVGGRDTADKVHRRVGSGAVSVWLASRSGRGNDDARRGAVDVTGVFSLAEQAMAGLQDLAVATSQRLLFVEEQPVGGEDGMVVWEQRYEVRATSGFFAPLFNGAEILGPLSDAQVEVGELVAASSSFSMPGIDGVFVRVAGTRERPIMWRGQLRATNDWDLNDLESNIEQLLRAGGVQHVGDPWGRTHTNCVMRSFRRQGPRRRDPVSGQALQDFEIEFIQLSGD